jgi:hypothetical protein
LAFLVISMLSIKELCNPRFEVQIARQIPAGAKQKIGTKTAVEKRVIRRRNRFTLEERFAIIKELKYTNCISRAIAIAYKTSERNIARWKALYESFEKRVDIMNNVCLKDVQNVPRDAYRSKFKLPRIHSEYVNSCHNYPTIGAV